MTNRLYKRGCKVTVYQTAPAGFVAQNPQFFELQPNAIEITGLRVQFKIEKSLDATPNKSTVTITNCASRTRAYLQTTPLVLRLDAGYDDNLRHVFTGDLRWGNSDIVDADWETKLELADGDRAYRSARVSRSYKKGTSVAIALKEAAAAMGLQLATAVAATAELQSQFATGRTLHGPAGDELTRLLAPFGYHWSIQDGKLQVLKDQNADASTALTVSQSSGMVGSPEFGTPEKKGKPTPIKIRSLLYPEITPGGRIAVDAANINGIFRVAKVTHDGDTHGDNWFSEIEATPLAGEARA